MSGDSERKTGYLDLPGAEPMPDRPERPKTDRVGAAWKLQVTVGETHILLDIADTVVVGRFVEGDDPHIPVLDLTQFEGFQGGVSRRHASIIRRDDNLFLEDHGSTNGTRINGFQLTPRRQYRLRDGDVVEFSRLRTVFHFVNPE